MPHRDVATGQYQQAEFAADPHQVWRERGGRRVRQAAGVLRRTFLAEGLRDVLLNATRRLRGEGGEPVVQLQSMSRGLTEAEASAMIFSGFVEPITKELLELTRFR